MMDTFNNKTKQINETRGYIFRDGSNKILKSYNIYFSHLL